MTLLIANLIIWGSPLTHSEFVLILLFIAVVMFVGVCRQIIDTWIKRTRSRSWPTVSAVIDIVSVAFIPDDSIPAPSVPIDTSRYLATLTYLYNYPNKSFEQQMGDYSRNFGNEDDAKAWANSYKGETVKVHVDPRDPTRSVLREVDL